MPRRPHWRLTLFNLEYKVWKLNFFILADMARPRLGRPLDEFTTTDLGVGGGMPRRNVLYLDERSLLADVGTVGNETHRVGTIRTLRHIAVIGAFQAAGFDLVLAAKLVAPVADHLEARYGSIPTRMDRYLDKDLNPRFPEYPWPKRENDPLIESEFWVHYMMRTRAEALYRRGEALLTDFVVEVVDRRFVYLGALSKAADTRVVGGMAYPLDPMFRLVGLERGVDEVQTLLIAEEAGNLSTPEGKREHKRLEAEYFRAYVHCMGRVHVNVSLAVRNAMDAVHEHRLEKGIIVPEIERRDDSPVP